MSGVPIALLLSLNQETMVLFLTTVLSSSLLCCISKVLERRYVSLLQPHPFQTSSLDFSGIVRRGSNSYFTICFYPMPKLDGRQQVDSIYLDIRKAKCCLIRFYSRSKSCIPSSYHHDGVEIPAVDHCRDLVLSFQITSPGDYFMTLFNLRLI